MTALQTVNDHYQVIIDKDIEGIYLKYFNSEETYLILEGPRLTTIGFEKIKKGWRHFCNSKIRLLSITWAEGPFTEEQDSMAWVAGVIKIRIKVDHKELENIFRASFVLIKNEGVYKIKHEHVSLANPDPYGIGDWLLSK